MHYGFVYTSPKWKKKKVSQIRIMLLVLLFDVRLTFHVNGDRISVSFVLGMHYVWWFPLILKYKIKIWNPYDNRSSEKDSSPNMTGGIYILSFSKRNINTKLFDMTCWISLKYFIIAVNNKF